MKRKKKTKECKVKYVEDLDTGIEVSCAEIKMIYKVYGRTNRGYQLLATKNNKQQAIDYAKNLNFEVYDSGLVIEHNKETNTDFPIDLERR